MKRFHRRSFATERYIGSKPSSRNLNLFLVGMCALFGLAFYNHSNAKLQMKNWLLGTAQAQEMVIEGQSEWVVSVNGEDKPCIETEDDVTCIVSETTYAAPVKVTKPKAINPSNIPQKYWDLATKICTEQKQDKVECPRYLLAVATVESVFGTRMVGDGGASQGWFHIYKIHNKTVSLECKMDFYCAGTWSLKRMIGNGYANPKMREWAVASHNSVTPEQNAIYFGMVKQALNRIK